MSEWKRRRAPEDWQRWLLVVICQGVVAGLVWWLAPARGQPAAALATNWLRTVGGGLSLIGVLVAAVTARGPARARNVEGRVRFISEMLALGLRGQAPLPTRGEKRGSHLATGIMAIGAVVFGIGALCDHGYLRLLGLATGVLLLLVVLVRLIDEPDPLKARWYQFGHPTVAAGFYLAAVGFGWWGLSGLGPVGWWLGVIHLATSLGLIAVSIVGSVLSYPLVPALWPAGCRILLDVAPGTYAGCVRAMQWPATLLVGVALCGGALGL